MHAQEFATQGKDATLVETPDVVEHVEPLLAHEPVEIEARTPDDPLPQDFDLAFVPRAFRTRGPDENGEFVDRVAVAVVSGGTAVFVDAFRDSTPNAAVLDVERLATTEAGRVYEETEAFDWLADAGLVEVRSVPVPGTADGAVIGAA